MFIITDFKNNEIRKKFKNILKNQKFLTEILNYLEREYREIIVEDVVYSEKMLEVILKCDTSMVSINVDLGKNETMIICPSWPYTVVFSNYVTKSGIPVSRVYRKGERSIIDRSVKYIDSPYSKVKIYELVTPSENYNITVNEFDKPLDKDLLINNLLDSNNYINDINDVFIIIKKTIDISSFEIKINTTKYKSDVLIVYEGSLTKYIFYKENDKYKEKIYLENNDFFSEKTIKEKIEGDNPLIKKIGGRK